MEAANLKTAPIDTSYVASALEGHLAKLKGAIVAFSGGVDSGVLAHAAHQALGEKMVAVLATGSSLASRERVAAEAFAKNHNIPFEAVATAEMEKEGYRANAGDRCFYCKQALFERLEGLKAQLNQRGQEGWEVVYGVNLDDLGDYRPGLKAAEQAEVVSPYLDLEIDKAGVRALARHYQLEIAEKAAMPCLASRIPHGRRVDPTELTQVERAEDLLHTMGLAEGRVRHHGDIARIEVPAEAMPWLLDHREAIDRGLREIGFSFVSLDLGGFRSGSLNRVLQNG